MTISLILHQQLKCFNFLHCVNKIKKVKFVLILSLLVSTLLSLLCNVLIIFVFINILTHKSNLHFFRQFCGVESNVKVCLHETSPCPSPFPSPSKFNIVPMVTCTSLDRVCNPFRPSKCLSPLAQYQTLTVMGTETGTVTLRVNKALMLLHKESTSNI